MPRVWLANGKSVWFPDGTPQEEIDAALNAMPRSDVVKSAGLMERVADIPGRVLAEGVKAVGGIADWMSPDAAPETVVDIGPDSTKFTMPFTSYAANAVNRFAEARGNIRGSLDTLGAKVAETFGASPETVATIREKAAEETRPFVQARAAENERRRLVDAPSLEQESAGYLGNIAGEAIGAEGRAIGDFYTSDLTRAKGQDFGAAYEQPGLLPAAAWIAQNPGSFADIVAPSVISSMIPASVAGRATKAGLMGTAVREADLAERAVRAAGGDELAVIAERTKALTSGTMRAEKGAQAAALGTQAAQVTEMNSRQQAEEIRFAPIEELRKNPTFVELASQLGEDSARLALAQRVYDGNIAAGLPINLAATVIPGRLGLAPAETALAGGAAATGRVASKAGISGRVMRAGVKGAQESAGEWIQGGGEQLAQNIAGVPTDTAGGYWEDVGKNAMIEGMAGGPMGAITGMFTGPAAPAAARGEALADQFFRDSMPKFAPLAETGQTDPAASMSTPPPAIPPQPVSRPTAPPAAVVPPSSTAGMPSLADVGLDLTNPVDPLEQQLAAAGAAPVLAPRVPQPAPTPTRQSVRYAPRNEGETDKEYAKRVVDKTAAPESLVDDPSLYFNPVEGAQTVPVNKLLSTKTAAENVEGGTNGAKRMAAAAAGVLGKRDPIDVMANPDGTFSVVDGNGTLTAAKAAGLTNLPVRVVGQQTVEEAAARAGVPAPAIPGFAGMYARAAAVSPKFDEAMRTIAESLGAKALLPGLKSIKRAADKVVGEYGGDPGRLKDLVRGTLEISTLDDAPATIETLQQQFGAENVTLKRNHLDPNASPFSSTGYRDALALVTVDGVTTEVQVSTPEMLAAKKAMHDKYVRQSEIERAVAARASESNDLETMPTMEALRALVRSSTVTERAERRALVREQRAAYTAAFAASTSRANSASSISESTSSSKNAVVQNTFFPPSKMNPPISPQAAGLPSMIPNRVSPAIAASSTGPETSVAQARVAGATRASTSGEAAPAVEVTDQLRAHARRLQVAVTAAEVVEGKGNKGAAKTRVFHTVQEALDAGFNVTPDQDGFYDIDTDTVGIIAANTTSADRALWIAWHEKSGHRGLIGTFGDSPALVAELKRAGTNPIVRAVAEALRAQRDAEARKQDPRAQPMSDSLAIEEALAELQAAVRTGNWREISKRYGVEASGIEKKSVADVLRRMLRAIRAAITGAGGKSSAYSNEDVMQLLEVAHQRGMGGAVSAEGDVRASKAKPATTGGGTDPKKVATGDRIDVAAIPKGPRKEVVIKTDLDAAFKLASASKFKKGRELKVALQALSLAEQKSSGVNLREMTQAAHKALVAAVKADARYAMESNANAVGWYNKTVAKALEIIAIWHPEMLTDQRARLAMKWAIAVTSNGLKVDKNFELAMVAYEGFKKDGVFPTDIGIGQAGSAINDGLKAFNDMSLRMPPEQLEKFISTKFTVGEIEGAIGIAPGGEWKGTTVRGAAILGPKIGNGFLANLLGYFDALTMDRWLMRTWGRWTGELIIESKEQIESSRRRLGVAINSIPAKDRAKFAAMINREIPGRLTDADSDAIALAIAKATQKLETRDAMAELGADGIRKAGNTLAKALDGQKEAPSGPGERNWIRTVFGDALVDLQTEFPGLTMSDLQALLWYPEKRLYDAAKAEEDIDEGYADDEAPDYANAAAGIARLNGVSDQEIAAAQKRAVRAGTKAGAAFTAEEKAEFLRTVVAPPEQLNSVTFEVAPNPDDITLSAAWSLLPQAERKKVTSAIGKQALADVLEVLGLDVSKAPVGITGGYEGEINPSLVLEYAPSKLSVEQARALAGALGMVLEQKAMIVADERLGEKVTTIRVTATSGSAEKYAAEIFAAIQSVAPWIDGFSARGKHLDVVSFDTTTPDEIRRKVVEALALANLPVDLAVSHGDISSIMIEAKDYGQGDGSGVRPENQEGLQRARDRARDAFREAVLEYVPVGAGTARRGTRASTKRSRPDAAGDRRARGGDGGAEEGGGRGEGLGWNERPVQADAVAIVGVHYSRKAGLKALDGSKYGSNHQGAEWKRIQNALYQDEDRFAPIANRVYFYPKGTKLEAGESMVRSPNRHEIPLANLYDYEGDPGKLYYEADNDNEFELAVIEAGYDGYVTEDMAVVLGTKPIPTRASTKRASVEYGSSDWDALVEDALLESGQTIANSNAAMRLWSDGRHRIFAMHENAETVDEVTSIDMLRANTPDQLMALPSDVAAEYGITERPTRASTVNPVETARADANAKRETYSDLSKQLRDAMAGTGRMELATARARRLIGEVAAIGDVDALLRDARRELTEAKRAIDDEGRDALPEYDRAMAAVATLQRTGKEARAKAAEANRLLDALERAERTGTLAQRQLQLERLLDAVESSREAYEAAAKIRDWRRSRQRAVIKARQKRGDTLNKLAAEGMPQGNITWSVDAAARKGLLRVARRALQDKMIEVRDIGKAIAEAIGQELPDLLNLYQAENLMHGKAEEGIEAVQRTLVEPLKAAIKATGLSNAEIHKYLWARHAEERNKRIAEINPGMPDGGSGMSTARARQVLADFAAAGKMPRLEAVGRRVQAIRHHTLDTLLRSGQITPELHNRLSTMYQHYVPLRGDPKEEEGESRIGTGRGLDVRGNPFQRALGRNTEPRDILGELVGDAERAVLQGAKAEVGRTLLRMALQFPNKDVWEVEPVIVEPKFSEATGEVYLAVAQADQEQTVIVKHNGKPYAVRLVDPRLREAVLGYGVNGTEAIAKLLGWANRWLSAVSTRLNPAFVAVNMIRDMIQGSMAIGSELGAGALKESLILYGPAMKAMWQSGNGAGDSSVPDAQKTMVDWAREFAEAGGKTGHASVADPETVQQRIENEMATIGQLLRDKKPIAAVAQTLQRSTIMQGIERANDSAENALRLAVYVHMRKAGSTQPKAAQYAKNVTINFNRRGHLTGALNALYLFFNASMQGGHRTLQLLSDKRILATLGTVGAAQGALAITAGMMTFGDDDDETLWEQIPDYVREKAFVIPLGFSEEGDPQYAAIPMPFGFNLFTMVGGYPALVASDTWRSRQDKSWQATMLADVARSSIDAFSVMPLGEEGWFMPTLARMQQNFAANKDDLGNSIRSMAAQRGDAPRAYAGKADASDAARAVAIALNRLGGGDEVTKPVGWLDYAPEDIEYMIGQVTGGAGNSLQQLLRVSTRAVRGMDIAPGDIPVTGRLVGSQRRERVDQRMFYEASDRMDSGLDRLRLAFVDGGIDAFEQQKAELGPAFEGVVIARYKTTDRKGGYRRGDYRIDSDTGRPTFVAIPGSTFDYYKDAKRKSDDYSDIIKATYSSDVLSGEERAKQVEALQIERAAKVRDFMRSWNQASKQ